MNEMIKKVIDYDEEALNSLEKFIDTAKGLGYSQEEIDEALEQVEGFPLDDDMLDEITGGYAIVNGVRQNFTDSSSKRKFV